jgi:hypothetical protein
MNSIKTKLILGLALILSGVLVGCSFSKQSPSKTHFGEIPQNMSKAIEMEVPELKCLGATNGTSPSAMAWNGGEQYMQAAFYLRRNPRYHPAREFPREPAKPLPYADLNVVIVSYSSADEAQRQVHKSLMMRQAAFQPAEAYKDGTLHRYCDAAGGVQDLIYQSHRFVVEIDCYSRNVEPLTMKVLDAVLTEIKP